MTKALVLLKGDSKKLKARLGADLAKRVESATPNKGMINPILHIRLGLYHSC